MKANQVNVMALAEVKTTTNHKEVRSDYTWFFSGEARGNFPSGRNAGVALVLRNSLARFLLDAVPINTRMLRVRLHGTPNITLFVAYAPTAPSETATKTLFYKTLTKEIRKPPKKEFSFLLGDFNARVQRPFDDAEYCIGPYTFDSHHTLL